MTQETNNPEERDDNGAPGTPDPPDASGTNDSTEDPIAKNRAELHKNLKDGVWKDRESEFKIARAAKKAASSAVDQNKVELAKAVSTRDEYTNIRHDISTKVAQASLELDGNVGALQTAFDSEFVKLTDEAVKCVKSLDKKCIAVSGLICQLKSLVKDSCNQPSVKRLDSGLSPEKGKKTCKFEDEVKNLDASAKTVCDESAENFEVAVKLSGLRSQLNFGGVKASSAAVVAAAGEFGADVEGNVEAGKEKVKAAETSLNAAIAVKTTTSDDAGVATEKFTGVNWLLCFLEKDTEWKPNHTPKCDEHECGKDKEGKPKKLDTINLCIPDEIESLLEIAESDQPQEENAKCYECKPN